ncbi:hypothetical protein GIB67_037797 [Kingdonia uniflora]|uniref:NAC domain-containing protein n=1 Tax=Kingdonia uniflora TaxID=39325 RepID=A0A7J7LV92_9MAGN|nr:hypothetical protein GIB67_037797 [Kingdonia uniflora]
MMKRERDAEAELNLPPGFRFHPTDEELVVHYLCKKISYQCLPVPIIAEVDLYKYDPQQLPEKALFGTKEWYFFTPRDRKYPNGSRPNRAAGSGYWKATGADKPIRPAGCATHIGIKKALVFYSGKAPKGVKTNWIMHEYRLAEPNRTSNKKGSLRLDEWVLCRLYNKKNNWQINQNKKEQSMNVNTIDSFDTGSDSFTTLESDIENDSHIKLNHKGNQSLDGRQTTMTSTEGSYSMGECVKEEGSDWFTDFNLDELQSSLSAFGDQINYDYNYFSNLPTFWNN